MKKGSFSALAGIFILIISFPAHTFGFKEYLAWGQEERLRAAVSETVFFLNNQPLQIGTTGKSSHARMRTGVEGQYRFFDSTPWGRLEGFLDIALDTNQDIWDKMDAVFGLGLTIAGTTRLEFGSRNIVNIGAKNPEWGGRQYWLGACRKIFDSGGLFFDACGRYYLLSNISPVFSNSLETRNPLTADMAFRLTYVPQPYLSLTLAPHVGFDKKFAARNAGVAPSIEYFVGKHFSSLPQGISLVAGGDFSTDINTGTFDGSSMSNLVSPRDGIRKEIGFSIRWTFN